MRLLKIWEQNFQIFEVVIHLNWNSRTKHQGYLRNFGLRCTAQFCIWVLLLLKVPRIVSPMPGLPEQSNVHARSSEVISRSQHSETNVWKSCLLCGKSQLTWYDTLRYFNPWRNKISLLSTEVMLGDSRDECTVILTDRVHLVYNYRRSIKHIARCLHPTLFLTLSHRRIYHFILCKLCYIAGHLFRVWEEFHFFQTRC